jgi:hypothetical protein
MKRFPALAALALAAALAGCAEDQSAADLRPDLSNNGGIFQRFVVLGTSIGAGLQSGGINDSTQRLAFPSLVAGQSGAVFEYPSLRMPRTMRNNTDWRAVIISPPLRCRVSVPAEDTLPHHEGIQRGTRPCSTSGSRNRVRSGPC